MKDVMAKPKKAGAGFPRSVPKPIDILDTDSGGR
jgi:hypothetical protein